MDTEQPKVFDPEHPYEAPDWGINEAAHDAAMTGAHYMVLRDLGVPEKRAENLTLAWMEMRSL